jgi:ADP-ribosylation factor-like protein 2
LKIEEIKNLLELEKITSKHWIIMSCFGLNGEGLEEGLNWIIDDISSRIFMLR